MPRRYLQLFSHWGLKFIALFYQGKNVQCPICEAEFREFLPYGRKSRPNALCPSCLSLERHRLIWLYLKQKTDFFSHPYKMLHIAPELCFMSRFEDIKSLDYVTGDIESPLATVKMDIHEIPFEDNSFDIIFCNHVLEHVKDDILAMKEIKRVLKPGGWAILQVPFFFPLKDETFEDPSITSPKDREQVYGQDDHVRMYGKDYPERIRRAGLKVIEVDFVHTLKRETIHRFALPENEVIYRAEKAG